MNCNGTRLNTFIAIYLLIILLQFAIGQQHIKMEDDRVEEDQLDTNGNLYDIFKRRLEKIRNELSLNAVPRSGGRANQQYAVMTTENKKRAINDCLYEEFKRRVDKFCNDLAQNPNKAFKRKIAALFDDNEEKRSTIRESLYEEYKKRLDNINNELALDDEKVFDRSGRNSQCATDHGKQIFIAPQNADTTKQIENNIFKGKKLHYKRNDGGYDRVIDVDFDTFKQNDCNKLRTEKSHFKDVILHNGLPQNERITSNLLKLQNDRITTSKSECISGQKMSAPVLENKDNFVDERESSDTDEESVTRDEDSQGQLYPADSFSDDIAPYGADIGSSYPTVLTKAFETNLSPVSPSPSNLLATVAQKMNTSPLELAQKLTNMSEMDTTSIRNDPKFIEVLQKYITNTVGVDMQPIKPPATVAPPKQEEKERKPKETLRPNILKPATRYQEELEEPPNTHPTNSANATVSAEQRNIAEILDKILTKLERIQLEKANASDKDSIRPEGAPCDVIGSWNSLQMGIRFEIALAKSSDRMLGPAEKDNKLLGIEAFECIPPKHHRMLDLDWKYMGSAMKQLGGPLYIYTQQRADNIVALFAGYCRTCGGIDTIFGSWTILYPCKDCQDISTSIENRRDIFRRYRMEVKRKQRFKDLLFQKSRFSKMQDCISHM